MTTTAWIFMSTAFIIITSAAVLALNKILRNKE